MKQKQSRGRRTSLWATSLQLGTGRINKKDQNSSVVTKISTKLSNVKAMSWTRGYVDYRHTTTLYLYQRSILLIQICYHIANLYIWQTYR